jgi:hypothetical protein
MKRRSLSLGTVLLVCLAWPLWAQDSAGKTAGTAAPPAAQNQASASSQSQPAQSGSSQQNQTNTGSQNQPAQSGSSQQNQTNTSSQSQPAQSDSSQSGAAEKSPEYVPQSQNPDKETHNGDKNDIDAIGNRKVGGRGVGDWYSLETEIRMGKQYSQQVEATVKLVQDPVINEYVNRIGQNLVRNSDAKVPFTIKVIDSDEINAFTLPGGFFYVNSGLILAADEEAELAGVMAHEIAHVAARHAMRGMTRANLANIASVPLIFVGGGLGYGIYEAAGIGIPMTFMKFSRNFEAEADYLGLQYMYKTGYDPQAFIAFFEKLEAKEKSKPGTIGKAFASHPQTPDRIEKSQEEIAHVLPARDQYIVNTSEFDDVKARLAAIENRRKLVDQKDNAPSLRRTSNSSGNSGSNGSGNNSGNNSGDDTPTLKRRSD